MCSDQLVKNNRASGWDLAWCFVSNAVKLGVDHLRVQIVFGPLCTQFKILFTSKIYIFGTFTWSAYTCISHNWTLIDSLFREMNHSIAYLNTPDKTAETMWQSSWKYITVIQPQLCVIPVHPPFMSGLSQFITTTVHFNKAEKINEFMFWLVVFLT